MKVLLAATECRPLASSGELGESVAALARALRARGCDARVIMPRYRNVPLDGAREVIGGLPVPVSSKTVYGRVLETTTPEGVPVYLVDQPDYYDRAGYYVENGRDYPDNAERFVFFSRAVVEFLLAGPFEATVVHAHDWFTGLVPVYLRTLYAGTPRARAIGSVFAIHDVSFQGLFWHYDMHLTGLPWSLFRYDRLEFHGRINFQKGGITHAGRVVVPSPGYAREILAEPFGCGLSEALRGRGADFEGVAHGIDTEHWNPAVDAALAARYDASEPGPRVECKRDLQRLSSLPESDAPLLACVSAPGEDEAVAMERVLRAAVEREGQVVVASPLDRPLPAAVGELARNRPLQVGVNPRLNAEMTRKILAGADLLFAPALRAPSGFECRRAARYGAIPLAPSRGGNPGAAAGGFLYEPGSEEGAVRALDAALVAWRDPARRGALVASLMGADGSCAAAAERYQSLYEDVSSRPLAPELAP